MKLVEGAQLLGREPLMLRPKRSERRLQPLGQAGRAIVVAHTIEYISHCEVPLRLQAVVADLGSSTFASQMYDRFLQGTIRDNVDRV
jgi:hypothetical protein